MGTTFTSLFENRDFMIAVINDCEMKAIPLSRSIAIAAVVSEMEFAIPATLSAEIIVPYECTNGKCDFAKAIATIAASNELIGISVKQYVQIIVETIAENPCLFPNESISGYVVKERCHPAVILENKTKGIKGTPKYGTVDVIQARWRMESGALKKRTDMLFWRNACATIGVPLVLTIFALC